MPMLEQSILDQLKSVFSALDHQVDLVYHNSNHDKQAELVSMLDSVATTSEKISVQSSGKEHPFPQFQIYNNGSLTGVTFSGIPGGHEFSSFVLAILNSDLKGKLPDAAILSRVKALKGRVKLKTYISLSCENCPDVVQALNLMAILKPDFSHEMVDGEFVPDEISELNIQGVPSVMVGYELLHSGKSSFMELLTKLETKFGHEEKEVEAKDLGQFDVTVVGAGPAGVSAAIYTARKGLKTIVITDRVGGQMQDTKGIENFISVPYTEGPELSQSLYNHLKEYDITLLEHRRVEQVGEGTLKDVTLNSGETLTTKALVVATGAKWRELGIEGEKEYIGRGVAFCPHCDGPYYKGKDISVIGGGNSGVEAAIDLAGIVRSVTLIEFAGELKADQVLVNKLNSLDNVKVIVNARTHRVIGDQTKVTGLEFEDRASGELKTLELDGIFVQIGLLPNSQFVSEVVETNSMGEIVIDQKCHTSTAGIYAAGDVTNGPYKQIIISMGEGAKAGLSVFEDLML
jgi:alkyl hydroperoxide reductase subunit F